MKIAIASDVHGLYFDEEKLKYPEADLLVFCGDILGDYAQNKHVNARDQLDELEQFNILLEDFRKQEKYREIICIAGNHGFVFQHLNTEARKVLTNATYLQDESYIFDGYKIYGSPWQPYFGNWAFNFPDHQANFFRARAHARTCWDKIPDDTAILITHSPPLNILDETSMGFHAGCQYLGERIDELDSLILHAFGHIHAGRGNVERQGVLHVNAANCYSHDSISYPVTLVEIDDNDQARIVESSRPA